MNYPKTINTGIVKTCECGSVFVILPYHEQHENQFLGHLCHRCLAGIRRDLRLPVMQEVVFLQSVRGFDSLGFTRFCAVGQPGYIFRLLDRKYQVMSFGMLYEVKPEQIRKAHKDEVTKMRQGGYFPQHSRVVNVFDALLGGIK